MSEKRYITPEEFEKREAANEIKVVSFNVGKTHINEAERVINALRPINKKDDGFVYSCRCNASNHTEWLFGYTDYDVYREVDKKVDEEINKIWEEQGSLYIPGLCESPDCTASCTCPFNPVGSE